MLRLPNRNKSISKSKLLITSEKLLIPDDETGEFGISLLSSLEDTNINNPSPGQLLSYNGSTWENTNVTGVSDSLDNLTNVDISTPSVGQILTYTGSNWVNEDNIAVPDVALDMFPDKTLFTDDAGPTTTVAAFGKIQDHPTDNKLRIVQ